MGGDESLMHILKQAEQFAYRVADAQGVLMNLPIGEAKSYFHSIIGPEDVHPDFAEDIRQNGVREPIEISTDGTYARIDEGHHRTLAAEAAGQTHIPARVFQIHPTSMYGVRNPIGESLRAHGPIAYGT